LFHDNNLNPTKFARNMSVKTAQVEKRKLKLVFVGDEAVGKTSIMARYILERFETKYATTIGIDFFHKTVIDNNIITRLHIWDTAGMERYRSLLPSYIRDAQIAIVVYDISNKKSFENAKKWIENVKLLTNGKSRIILVGNKMDLRKNLNNNNNKIDNDSNVDIHSYDYSKGIPCIKPNQNISKCENIIDNENIIQVSNKDALALATELNISFMEVSAKNGKNIDKLFATVVNDNINSKESNDEINNNESQNKKDKMAEKTLAKEESFQWCCAWWSFLF